MSIASALKTKISCAIESTYGVALTDKQEAFSFPRVSFSMNQEQSVIESQEIKDSMQLGNYDRGMNMVKGSLKGELAPGSYDTLISAALRQNFNTGVVTDITLSDVSSAVAANNLTTSGGSWSTAGQLDLSVGDVISFSGFTGANKTNNNLEWLVIAFAAGTMKLGCKNAARVMFADAAGEVVTIKNITKNKTISRNTIAAVADTAIFTTVAGDFTTVFSVGNIVKHVGFTGGSADNDGKGFVIRKITATELFGYYNDFTVPASDAAGEEVNFAKQDTVAISWTAANDMELVSTTTLVGTGVNFVAEGFKVHDVIRLVGFTTATNNGRNLIITSITSDSGQLNNRINFYVLDGNRTTVPIVVESGGSGAIVIRVGKKSFIPQVNHLDTSFTFEKWYSDISESELYKGCKINSMKIAVSGNAIPSIEFDIVGQQMTEDSTQYFDATPAATPSDSVSMISGGVFVNNALRALVTAFDVSVAANLNVLDKVIGSENTPDITAGMYKVSGNMTMFFTNDVDRNIFLNSTEVSLALVLRVSDTYNSRFVAIQMPRIIYNSGSISDEVKGNIITIPFTAFENLTGDDGTGASKLKSVISMQIL